MLTGVLTGTARNALTCDFVVEAIGAYSNKASLRKRYTDLRKRVQEAPPRPPCYATMACHPARNGSSAPTTSTTSCRTSPATRPKRSETATASPRPVLPPCSASTASPFAAKASRKNRSVKPPGSTPRALTGVARRPLQRLPHDRCRRASAEGNPAAAATRLGVRPVARSPGRILASPTCQRRSHAARRKVGSTTAMLSKPGPGSPSGASGLSTV